MNFYDKMVLDSVVENRRWFVGQEVREATENVLASHEEQQRCIFRLNRTIEDLEAENACLRQELDQTISLTPESAREEIAFLKAKLAEFIDLADNVRDERSSSCGLIYPFFSASP